MGHDAHGNDDGHDDIDVGGLNIKVVESEFHGGLASGRHKLWASEQSAFLSVPVEQAPCPVIDILACIPDPTNVQLRGS